MSDTRASRAQRTLVRVDRVPRIGRAVVILLLIATLIVVLLNVLIRPDAPRPERWTSVSVGECGTLWEVATAHPVPGLSTAQTVALIQQENGLISGTIYTGQVLRVPAAPVTDRIAVASR